MRLRILLIEKSSRRNHQIAHQHVLGIDPKNGDILLFAVADRNPVGKLRDRRRSDDSRNHFLHGVKIVDGKRIRIGVADVRRAAQIFRPDLVGADSLNLVKNKLPPGHSDGYDKDERSGADHHAQRSQDEAHLVAAESVVGEREDLAKGHLGLQALGQEGSSHMVRCYVAETKVASRRA